MMLSPGSQHESEADDYRHRLWHRRCPGYNVGSRLIQREDPGHHLLLWKHQCGQRVSECATRAVRVSAYSGGFSAHLNTTSDICAGVCEDFSKWEMFVLL